MCGSEYFNGRLVNKKDCNKIHGHDRSPKKGQHVKFLDFFSKLTHIFSKVISSDEQYNCYNISFDKDLTPAHCSLEAAVTKNNTVFIQNTVLLSNKTTLCNHAKNTALINKSPIVP